MIKNWPFPDAFAEIETVSTPDFVSFDDDWTVMDTVLIKHRPRLSLEIGSFTGNSSCHIGSVIKQWDGRLICVDTWLGSAGMWLDPNKRQWLDWQHGRPNIYQRFLKNVKCQGLDTVITPLPQISSTAAEIIQELDLSLDFIYWDGGHNDLGLDLEKFIPLLSPDGIWMGDDIDQHAVIKEQILRWLASNDGWHLQELGNNKWILQQNKYKKY